MKLDITMQDEILSNFKLHCPYVTVTEEYDSEGRGTVLWARADMLETREDYLLTEQPYFFNPEGSVLIVDAMAEHESVPDDPMMAEWIAQEDGVDIAH